MSRFLLLLALFGYAIFALVRIQAWRKRRRLPRGTAPAGYGVTIGSLGSRTGTIEYRERGNVCRFDWELMGTADGVLYIVVPGPRRWDREVPWAPGRRQEVLTRLADEVVRQACPTCTWEIEETTVSFHMKGK